MWRELGDRIDEQKIRDALHITDNDMAIEYGENSIRAHGFRQASGSHSAKLKSLANYNTVIIEEAEEVGEHEFRVLDDSLRTVKGDIKIIFLLNPPPKNHWIIENFFEATESKIKGFYNISLKVDNAIHIGGTFQDNIYNLDSATIARYKAYKKKDPDNSQKAKEKDSLISFQPLRGMYDFRHYDHLFEMLNA